MPYKRSVVKALTKIFGEDIEFLICKDVKGEIKILHQPEGKPEKRWVRSARSVKDAIKQIKSGPILYDDGEPLVDCIPGTTASASMPKDLTLQHFVNHSAYYTLNKYHHDCGLHSSRQTLINWIYNGSAPAKALIEELMNLAI